MTTIRSGLVAAALAGAWLLFTPPPAAAQKRDRDLITREEILSSAQKDKDLYQAIRSLRPHFLQGARGTTSVTLAMSPPVVYVDGGKQGDPSVLKTILASSVEEVRHLSPSQAESDYGVGHDGGALLVKLFQPPKRPPPHGN
jgi:hypothetical protein